MDGQKVHENMLNTDNIRENQIKTMKYHVTESEWPLWKCLQITNAAEGVEKKEPFDTIGRNINLYSHCVKDYGSFFKKLKAQLLHNPAIPLLGIYLGKTVILKDTWIPTFSEALFTIAKTWKQPKCPLTDEWIKMWDIYTIEYYSAIKRMK